MDRLSVSQTEKIRGRFGPAADAYAACPVQSGDFTLNRLLELLEPDSSWEVVDLATGAGHTALQLAPHVQSVTAVDLTPEMLNTARSLAKERNLHNLSFVLSDAARTGLPDSSFDLATCRLAVHHFPHVPSFLAECLRLLRPGGHLAIIDSHLPDNPALDEINRIQRIHDPSHIRCLTIGEYRQQIRDAGFVIQTIEEGKVRLEFDSWVDRANLPEETVELLREHMTALAHECTRAVLEVAESPERGLEFYFLRLILIAEKPA